MRILHFASSEIGGAGRSAINLNENLRKNLMDSDLISRSKDRGIIDSKNPIQGLLSSSNTLLQANLIQNSDDLVTIFSIGFLKNIERYINNYDVFHLHSYYNLLNYDQIRKIVSSGKPVFITLHDQRMFTGGCHCSRNCEGYLLDCTNCPQVYNFGKRLVKRNLIIMKEIFSKENVHVIAPSKWMQNIAKKSSVFSMKTIHHIPNIVEIKKKKQTKTTTTNFNSRSINILFIASSLNDSYKGLDTLIEAINEIDNRILKKLKFRFVGSGKIRGLKKNVKFLHVPRVSHDKIDEVFSGIDLLILPSTQDNFPNVMVEALQLGITIIGSDVGGIPTTLKEFGMKTFVSKDSNQLAKLISEFNKEEFNATDIRNKAMKIFDAQSLTLKHIKLYQESILKKS